MKTVVKKIITLVSGAALSLPVVAVTSIAIPTDVAAQKGGNGNSSDRGGGRNAGNSRGNSANQGNRQSGGANASNGRGAIARELGSLNAANANQNGLSNSALTSRTGELYAYQQAVQSVTALESEVTRTGDLFNALSNMTEEQFAQLNPTLDYGSTMTQAGIDYQNALNSLGAAKAGAESSLYALTGGRQLSQQAMAELHALLGL